MSEQEEPRLEAHVYDGIYEYDNPAPMWWKLGFLGTFIFSVGYFVYFHVLGAPGVFAQYEAERMAFIAWKSQQQPQSTDIADEQWRSMMDDNALVARGKATYDRVCAACHGARGEGTVGPNLTDEYWIHGVGRMPDVYKVVQDGVVKQGMIAWKDQLSPTELNEVVAYVGTLLNTNVEGKAPQGERAPREAAAGGVAAQGAPVKARDPQVIYPVMPLVQGQREPTPGTYGNIPLLHQ